jgi:hypothetical protein
MKVYKAMGRPTIEKSRERLRDVRRSRDWKEETIGRGKSGRVKSQNLHGCMIGDNATLRPCGVVRVASYFFESEDSATGAGSVDFVVVARAFAFFLLQSFAMWPAPPQNIQSLLSKRRCRSSCVNLPSLPSFPCSSGDRDAGAEGRGVFDLAAARSGWSDFLSEDFPDVEGFADEALL